MYPESSPVKRLDLYTFLIRESSCGDERVGGRRFLSPLSRKSSTDRQQAVLVTRGGDFLHSQLLTNYYYSYFANLHCLL